MKKVKNLATLNLIFYVIAFAVSNLSQLKLFGGVTNKDISDKYDTVFTPAGLTFAIWGVIYLSLFFFTIRSLIKATKEDIHSENSQDVLRIGNLFIINNIATTFWVFAFTYEYILLSTILIIIQLITLVMIFVRLNLLDRSKTFENKLFTQFPLSIYFAWLCVANVANISLCLVYFKWDGFGISPGIWAMALVSVVILLSIFIILAKRNWFFGLVAIWSLYGIYLKRQQVDPQQYPILMQLCLYGLALLAVLVIVRIVLNLKHKTHAQAINP
ncbi:MAG TPA: hypothetical protein VF273_07830 [Pelobium sp.]